MKKLVFEFMPISTNKLYVGRKILTEQARVNKEALGWEANAQYHGDPIEERIGVNVHFYYPDRRANDIDNLKILFDAMKGIVWKDDRQIDEQHVYRHFGHPIPRVELQIFKL